MPPPSYQSYGHKKNTNEAIIINIIIVVVIGFTFSKRNTGILLDKRGTVTTFLQLVQLQIGQFLNILAGNESRFILKGIY